MEDLENIPGSEVFRRVFIDAIGNLLWINVFAVLVIWLLGSWLRILAIILFVPFVLFELFSFLQFIFNTALSLIISPLRLVTTIFSAQHENFRDELYMIASYLV